MSIEVCRNCGGLYCTPPDAMFAGKPCSCDKAETPSPRHRLECDHLKQELADCQRQLNEARKDTERLDWWLSKISDGLEPNFYCYKSRDELDNHKNFNDCALRKAEKLNPEYDRSA